MIRLLFFAGIALLIPVLIVIGLQEYIIWTREPESIGIRCTGDWRNEGELMIHDE
jgi:hypothetical protein